MFRMLITICLVCAVAIVFFLSQNLKGILQPGTSKERFIESESRGASSESLSGFSRALQDSLPDLKSYHPGEDPQQNLRAFFDRMSQTGIGYGHLFQVDEITGEQSGTFQEEARERVQNGFALEQSRSQAGKDGETRKRPTYYLEIEEGEVIKKDLNSHPGKLYYKTGDTMKGKDF